VWHRFLLGDLTDLSTFSINLLVDVVVLIWLLSIPSPSRLPVAIVVHLVEVVIVWGVTTRRVIIYKAVLLLDLCNLRLIIGIDMVVVASVPPIIPLIVVLIVPSTIPSVVVV